MRRRLAAELLLAVAALLPSLQCRAHFSVRVMTFNVWNSGANVENGQQKIAKHILLVRPDIVALQEVYANVTRNLTMMLGPPWIAVENPDPEYPDTAILTRQLILPNTVVHTDYGVGAKILFRMGPVIHFWNVHLDWRSYGPYAAFNKLVTSENQILAGENSARGPEILDVLHHPMTRLWLSKTADVPLMIAGDFNGPSHLDWTKRAKKAHGDWEIRWPATKHLDDYGFVDSFREINPTSNPGYTWSTVNKFNPEWNYTIPEPQDRIDFIHYKGPAVPYQSFTYAGTERLRRIPYHQQNDYPSDHYAVVTDFHLY
ncbi:unnamed protein product [Caenorhabditis bovis]|uniref:Endonuclease/exonuclease/phosphatase domain-containing protein n=1 Tax=Caenorhabditis bovis TaxID=2654633 RepID=A0A8S1EDX9_9PELO|nr:unnamed protein product [Caenorhabditis bovis]